jgi:hypothetical protein
MARFGDAGPYSVANVYCATNADNMADIPWAKRSATIKVAMDRLRADPAYHHHLAVRGDGHPSSRAVLTPKGRFGSCCLAAEAFGVTRQTAARWAREARSGWKYEAGRPSARPTDDVRFAEG